MNNIKTVEVIKALPGLEVGDTLTRKDGDSNFELNVETVTEDYSAVRHISISQSLLNKEEFKAIDWFEKRKSNKEHIAELKERLSNLKCNYEELDEAYRAVLKDKKQLQRVLFSSKPSTYMEKCGLINKRIDEKIHEFETKYYEVENSFANGEYFGEAEQWADEAMTVYYNMIDLLKKLKA